MATLEELVIEITADTAKLKKGLADIDKRLKKTESVATKSLNKIKSGFKAAGAAATAFALTIATRELGSTIIKYEKLSASLVTVTGDVNAAKVAFNSLNEFVATTPFQLDEVVGAFIKLKALGLDPSEEALRSYGDTALAMGKSLDQMIEAVADASTFEFERLKEFGIRARQNNDSIIFSFQGVETEVRKSGFAVEDFLRTIGEENFAGAADRQMKTLGGAVSNLSDEFDRLLIEIGDAGITAFFTSVVKGAQDATSSFKALVGGVGDFFGVLAAGIAKEDLKDINSEIKAITENLEDSVAKLSGGEEGQGFLSKLLGLDESEFINFQIDSMRNRLAELNADRAEIIAQMEADSSKLVALEEKATEIKVGGQVDREKATSREIEAEKKAFDKKEKNFRGLISSAAQNNKALFNINKAFVLSDAILGAQGAIQDAYEWGTKIAGPAGGAIAAGTAAAATAANIAAISSSTFGGGGSVASPSSAAGGSVGNIEQAGSAISGDSSGGGTQTIEVSLLGGSARDQEFIREVIDGINEATDDGVILNVNVGSA